jgi:hypothetical protein
MKVQIGDSLIPDGDVSRTAIVIGLRNADGSPPYVVRWLSDGHITLAYPGPYTRIVPGNGTAIRAHPQDGE